MPEDDRGVIAFMADYVLDLGLFEDSDDAEDIVAHWHQDTIPLSTITTDHPDA